MEYNIGKIYNYDPTKGYGTIITKDKEYMFLIKDLEDKNIKNGDIVTFSGEMINNKYRAFLIKTYINTEKTNKEIGTKQ